MRTRIAVTLAAVALAMCGFTAQAQTNNTAGPVQPSLMGGLEQIGAAFNTATNWTANVSYGRMLTAGNNNLAFVGLVYNVNNNVGLVLGDEIIFGDGKPQISTVAGGITLKGTVRPLGWLGGTGWTSKLSGQLYVSDLAATPRNSNPIGNLVVTGINFNIMAVKNFELGAGVAYENRQGQGKYDGGAGLINLNLTRSF